VIKAIYSNGNACPHVFCDACGQDLSLDPGLGLAVVNPETDEVKFVCKLSLNPKCEQSLGSNQQGAKWIWTELHSFCDQLQHNTRL